VQFLRKTEPPEPPQAGVALVCQLRGKSVLTAAYRRAYYRRWPWKGRQNEREVVGPLGWRPLDSHRYPPHPVPVVI
jgi:hypothetical protein